MASEEVEAVATQIVDSAIKVHRALGPGLLESAYQACLAQELRKRGLSVECELVLPITYDGVAINTAYRIDMLVEKCIIIENKTVERLLPIHAIQLLTYLRLNGASLGFLLNWYTDKMAHGIKRIANSKKLD